MNTSRTCLAECYVEFFDCNRCRHSVSGRLVRVPAKAEIIEGLAERKIQRIIRATALIGCIACPMQRNEGGCGVKITSCRPITAP